MNIEQTQIRELSLPHGRDYCLVGTFVGTPNEDGETVPLKGERYVPLSLFLPECAYSTHWDGGGLYLRKGGLVGDYLWQVPSDFQLSPQQEADVVSFVERWNTTPWEYHPEGQRDSLELWVAQGDEMRGSRTESSSFVEEWGYWVDPNGIMSPVFVRAWWTNGIGFGSLAAPGALALEDALTQERRRLYNQQREDFPLWVEENREGLEKAMEVLVSIDCQERVDTLLAEKESARKAALEAKIQAQKARMEKVALLKSLEAKSLKSKSVKEQIAALKKELYP